MAEWPIQVAKNKFSALINAALAGEPQRVIRRGQPAVIVIAVEEYERLCQAQKAGAPDFIEHLLAIPRAPDDDAFELPTRTRDFRTREIGL